MRDKTTASLLTGGGLFDTGARQAGFSHLWGIEIEPDIAAVANQNGINTIIGDVTTFDYSSLERPYHLHASPVCVNASVASQGGECEQDIMIADGIIRAIETLQPICFTLENVWQYRDFVSFDNICNALVKNGYAVDYWHLNAANYGVPQTRKRLILIAHRERQFYRPQPTHAEAGDRRQLSFMDALPAWSSWYQAIEDLIPELPESQFADWQLERLPENMQFLLGVGQRSQPKPVWLPADTITSSDNQTGIRAFLMRSDNASQELCYQIRTDTVPAHTVVNSHKSGYPRAFIMDSANKSGSYYRSDHEPIGTVETYQKSSRPRAFIVNAANGSHTGNGRALAIRQGNEPAFTVTAQKDRPRTWLSQGCVVSMTPRALARFQSIPDDYELPDSNQLACKIIGNAVPPLLARRIMEML